MSTHSRVSHIRIGTRGSRLARWQAEYVAKCLQALDPACTVELVEIRTHGDRDRNTPLAAIGSTGLFTKEIQRALLNRSVDVAVHSLKDLPTEPVEGLVLAAVPTRESPLDALVAPDHRRLADLPEGARVGTSSLRRRAFLRNARPDLVVVEIRGNVETRLSLAESGQLHAVVLAEAGLRRLGLDAHITEQLAPPRFLPAVGQGALGIECRSEDRATADLLSQLDDPATHRCVDAERTLLATLHGGCLVPVGVWANEGKAGVSLSAALLDPEGTHRLDVHVGPSRNPAQLGHLAADALLKQGASELLRSLPRGNDPASR